MTRILIENYDLDVDKRLSNQITYSINDLKNLDSKTTSFTKTIVLQGTANNNTLLGNIFEFNNANFTNDANANVGYNFNASKTAKCSIQVEGMVVIKGIFKLLEIVIDGKNVEYECSVIGELGGLSMALGAKMIDELDFSAYNHQYSSANIVASWNNDNAGAGYYYPLIDYGNYSTVALFPTAAKKNWQVATFRPALFAKQYLEKIFAAAGYTYECDLFSTDRFKRLIIPHNQKVLLAPNTKQLNVYASSTTINPITIGTENLYQPNGSLGNFSTSDYKSFAWNLAAATVVNITSSIYVSAYSYNTGGVYNRKLTLRLLKNGAIIKSTDIYANGIYDLNIDNISLASTNTLALSISGLEAGESITYQTSLVAKSAVASLVPVGYLDTISLNDAIPKNVLQKDFFASILKLFNLYVDENRFDAKHLIIKPYVDYYDGTVEDWSDKIDRGKQIRIKPMSEMNSRYYMFKYKDDADYYNDLYKKRYNTNYGSRKFDSQYEFSKDTEEVQLIFSPTPLVGYSGETKVYSTILKQTNALEEQIDSNIRILIAQKMTGVPSYNIYNGATSITSQTAYGYAGHFNNPDTVGNDLNFGAPEELFFTLVSGALNVNQFNVYYSPFMAEITDKDSRLMSCNVKLTDVDIFNLNFASFKYIDGGLYRLIKLIDYTPEANETTKAEFLRVINKEY